MNMTQKAELSAADMARLEKAQAAYMEALREGDKWKAFVVEMIDRSSYREVARITGISTNTLQRWKREIPRGERPTHAARQRSESRESMRREG